MQYASGQLAAVAYKGADFRTFTMAFPFECIKDAQKRQALMRGILHFLVTDKKTSKK